MTMMTALTYCVESFFERACVHDDCDDDDDDDYDDDDNDDDDYDDDDDDDNDDSGDLWCQILL